MVPTTTLPFFTGAPIFRLKNALLLPRSFFWEVLLRQPSPGFVGTHVIGHLTLALWHRSLFLAAFRPDFRPPPRVSADHLQGGRPECSEGRWNPFELTGSSWSNPSAPPPSVWAARWGQPQTSRPASRSCGCCTATSCRRATSPPRLLCVPPPPTSQGRSGLENARMQVKMHCQGIAWA